MAPEPDVITSDDCGNSPKNARAQDIALALMGAGSLDPALLSDGVVWDRRGGSLNGAKAVLASLKRMKPPARIDVDQVVTHGRSGAVSGRFTTARGEVRIFCHMLRFTGASQAQIGQIVSFDNPDPGAR